MPRWRLIIFFLFAITSYSCVAEKLVSSSTIEFSTTESTTESCDFTDCSPCSILDLDTCTCTKIALLCAPGYIFSQDGCSCIESNATSVYCPDLICPPELHINEARCECTKKICQTFAPCPPNTIIDLETCECVCKLDQKSCPKGSKFNKKDCTCEHKKCNPPKSTICPPYSYWDWNLCQCVCEQTKICGANFTFDVTSCNCESYHEWESPLVPLPTCNLSDCRYCDFAEEENCICYRSISKCVEPYQLSEDGCECIKTQPAPCSSLSCRPGTVINQDRCVCMNETCADLPSCPLIYDFDPNTCHCNCFPNRDCIPPSYFDYETCQCIPKSTPSTPCIIPDCRWCDYLDRDTCTCYKSAIKCAPGYTTSSDGCRCIKSNATSIYCPDLICEPGLQINEVRCECTDKFCQTFAPCPDNTIIDLETCDCVCMLDKDSCPTGYWFDESKCSCNYESSPTDTECYIPDCRWCDHLEVATCECHKIAILCIMGYEPSEDGCTCIEIPNYNISETVPSPDCELPGCRWCDYADWKNCRCYKKSLDCFPPYKLSSDGCSCEFETPSTDIRTSDSQTLCWPPRETCPSTHYWDFALCSCQPQPETTVPSTISTSSSCYIPECRWCDYLDYSTCTCYKSAIKCAPGFTTTPDGCSCVKTNSSIYCPSSLSCPPGQHINEARCECTNKTCQMFEPCRDNEVVNLETCLCVCMLDERSCPTGSWFDESQCLCNSGPSRTDCIIENCRWCDYVDQANCQCIRQEISCSYGWQPSRQDSCICEEIPNFNGSTTYPSSSCTPNDCRWCDYFELNSCLCYTKYFECAPPSMLSDDGCTCTYVDSISSSTTTGWDTNSRTPCGPDISCPSGFYVDLNCTCQEIPSSTNPSPPCTLPGCRWCDHADWENCICYKKSAQCFPPYEISFDGCSCEFKVSSTDIWPSDTPTTCEQIASCPDYLYWDYSTCSCQYITSQSIHYDCFYPYILGPDGMTCIYSAPRSGPSEGRITDCPMYYYFDYHLQSCQPDPDTKTPSSETSTPSQVSCSIGDCRWCDHIDYSTCECHRADIRCLIGYRLSADGCSCEKISNCTGIICPAGTYLNEFTCRCDEFKCDSASSCPPNSIFDEKHCKCRCDLRPSECPQNYTYDPVLCICRHPPCDPPGPCPGKTQWDPELCRCTCRKREECPSNTRFDYSLCSCELGGSESSTGYINYTTEYLSSTSEESSSRSSASSVESSSIISSSSDESSYPESSSPCVYQPCNKWCDFYDSFSCQCYEVIVSCFWGTELTPDGCGCVESNSSNSCPGIYCDYGFYIDESTCECFKFDCSQYPSCLDGYSMHPETCDCTCHLTQNHCPPWHIFDEASCICRHPPCDPPGPCPGWSNWDSEKCRCVCGLESVECPRGYSFDQGACDCILENSPSSTYEETTRYSSETDCSIPYCRWCDFLDYENCTCRVTYVDCFAGYELSEDGCSCVRTTSTSENCPGVYCDKFLNLYIDEKTCTCLSFETSSESSPSPSITSVTIMGSANSSSSPCIIQSCRWCDELDLENCICYYRDHFCAPGYKLTQDGCNCEKSDESTESLPSDTEISTVSSSSSCEPIPYCRKCDIMDYENCVCHVIAVDCFSGYELSEDGCNCVKSNRTSENCPGIFCPKGHYIDEENCECLSENCREVPPCPKNLFMDSRTCECFCNKSPWQCEFPNLFDYDNCKCRHPPCDPVAPCPDNQSWDPEDCKCRCNNMAKCRANFIFDTSKCDCICDPKLLNTTCPSGSVFDELLCDCIEEIDCNNSDDPACNCQCPEVYDCPGKMIFDFDVCDCVCPIGYGLPDCKDGFVMDEESCECIKKKK